MEIRQADIEDWPRIWPIFADIVAAGETYAYPEDLTLETARSRWMEAPPGQTVIGVAGDKVVGSPRHGLVGLQVMYLRL